jgi:hypothetical protein
MLAIHAGKVSMAILLNGRPFCRLILREAVDSNSLNADEERQQAENQDNGSLQTPVDKTIFDLS